MAGFDLDKLSLQQCDTYVISWFAKPWDATLCIPAGENHAIMSQRETA